MQKNIFIALSFIFFLGCFGTPTYREEHHAPQDAPVGDSVEFESDCYIRGGKQPMPRTYSYSIHESKQIQTFVGLYQANKKYIEFKKTKLKIPQAFCEKDWISWDCVHIQKYGPKIIIGDTLFYDAIENMGCKLVFIANNRTYGNACYNIPCINGNIYPDSIGVYLFDKRFIISNLSDTAKAHFSYKLKRAFEPPSK